MKPKPVKTSASALRRNLQPPEAKPKPSKLTDQQRELWAFVARHGGRWQ